MAEHSVFQLHLPLVQQEGIVIIILVYIVCLIIITQRSLLDFVTMLVIRILDLIRERSCPVYGGTTGETDAPSGSCATEKTAS